MLVQIDLWLALSAVALNRFRIPLVNHAYCESFVDLHKVEDLHEVSVRRSDQELRLFVVYCKDLKTPNVLDLTLCQKARLEETTPVCTCLDLVLGLERQRIERLPLDANPRQIKLLKAPPIDVELKHRGQKLRLDSSVIEGYFRLVVRDPCYLLLGGIRKVDHIVA